MVRRGVAWAGGATGRAGVSNGDNNEGDVNSAEDVGNVVATIDGSLNRSDQAGGSLGGWGWGAFEEGGGSDAAGGSSLLEGSMTQRKKGAFGDFPERKAVVCRVNNRPRSLRMCGMQDSHVNNSVGCEAEV